MFNDLKIRKLRKLNGFTLIELLISMGVFAIVLVSSSIAYLNFQRAHNLDSYTTQIAGLIYQAQNQSMNRMCIKSCDVATSGDNFSIYIDTINQKVVLFRGLAYNSDDDYNIEIKIPNNLLLATNFPDVSIAFDKITGEIKNYNASNHTITITEKNSNNEKVLDLNKLGVININ